MIGMRLGIGSDGRKDAVAAFAYLLLLHVSGDREDGVEGRNRRILPNMISASGLPIFPVRVPLLWSFFFFFFRFIHFQRRVWVGGAAGVH